MQRHLNGTRIATRRTQDAERSIPRPLEDFLLGLGLAATCVVALLALTAMTNPVLADAPAAEYTVGQA